MVLYVKNQTYDAVMSVSPVLTPSKDGEILIGQCCYTQVGDCQKVATGYIAIKDGSELSRNGQKTDSCIFNICRSPEEVKRRIALAIGQEAVYAF